MWHKRYEAGLMARDWSLLMVHMEFAAKRYIYYVMCVRIIDGYTCIRVLYVCQCVYM